MLKNNLLRSEPIKLERDASRTDQGRIPWRHVWRWDIALSLGPVCLQVLPVDHQKGLEVPVSPSKCRRYRPTSTLSMRGCSCEPMSRRIRVALRTRKLDPPYSTVPPTSPWTVTFRVRTLTTNTHQSTRSFRFRMSYRKFFGNTHLSCGFSLAYLNSIWLSKPVCYDWMVYLFNNWDFTWHIRSTYIGI
jgi:hypothetical protein